MKRTDTPQGGFRFDAPPHWHPLSQVVLAAFGVPYVYGAGGADAQSAAAFPYGVPNRHGRTGWDALGFCQAALAWAGADIEPGRHPWKAFRRMMEPLAPSDTLQPFDIVFYIEPRCGLVVWPNATYPGWSTMLLPTGCFGASNVFEGNDVGSYVKLLPLCHYRAWTACRWLGDGLVIPGWPLAEVQPTSSPG